MDAILSHAASEHPRSACGLVAGPAGSDRPERFVRMTNAEHSPSFWSFDAVEQLRVWMEMDARDEEPIVIYYSQDYPEAYPSRVTIAMAVEPQAHYIVVSTSRPERPVYRSFRITDGQVAEEDIVVVDDVSDAGPQDRERLFDLAREKSLQRPAWNEADRLWNEVIGAYRDAVRSGPSAGADRQQLARALWRHAQLLLVLSRHAEAIAAGSEAVALFEQVEVEAASLDPDIAAAPRDQALGELITAMADLGEIRFAAGDANGRVELLDQALARGLRTAGPPPGAGTHTRQAMGTAYHNQAVALLHRSTQPHATDFEGVRQAALAASRATELRQNLLDESRPISGWELANTYVLFARCLALTGDLDRADAADGGVEACRRPRVDPAGLPGQPCRRRAKRAASASGSRRTTSRKVTPDMRSSRLSAQETTNDGRDLLSSRATQPIALRTKNSVSSSIASE